MSLECMSHKNCGPKRFCIEGFCKLQYGEGSLCDPVSSPCAQHKNNDTTPLHCIYGRCRFEAQEDSADSFMLGNSWYSISSKKGDRQCLKSSQYYSNRQKKCLPKGSFGSRCRMNGRLAPCLDGLICSSNTCKLGCMTNGDCPNGYLCNESERAPLKVCTLDYLPTNDRSEEIPMIVGLIVGVLIFFLTVIAIFIFVRLKRLKAIKVETEILTMSSELPQYNETELPSYQEISRPPPQPFGLNKQ